MFCCKGTKKEDNKNKICKCNTPRNGTIHKCIYQLCILHTHLDGNEFRSYMGIKYKPCTPIQTTFYIYFFVIVFEFATFTHFQ